MKNITEKILSKISDATIYQHYIGKYYPNHLVVPDMKITPPYDEYAGEVFSISEKDNCVMWFDENSKQQGDIFKLLKKSNKLNHHLVNTMIDFDFQLEVLQNNKKTNNDSRIQLTEQTLYWKNGQRTDAYFELEKRINKVLKKGNYDNIDSKKMLYRYFETLGISRNMVNEYELFELDHYQVIIEPFEFFVRRTMDYPLFAYCIGQQVKIIYPILKGKFKKFTFGGHWGSQKETNYIFGLKQLKQRRTNVKKLLLVTNEIDVMVLTNKGYDTVCVCGNNGILTKELFEKLSFAEKIIFLHQGSFEEKKIASILKRQFNILGINYQNLVRYE